ncbi:MAG: site-specific DNA-methyltransferase [Salinivirgaceae bacterium]|nr:site-specific DNA-methyltransferase [Salinivirgaceae bacterium]
MANYHTYNNFTLLHGDCMDLLPQIEDKSIDAIFADPPYFLSNGGISCQSGKVVCVDKGDWDKGGTPEHISEFNKQWLSLCRKKLKDNGSIWISGTYHNIFSVANCLTELGYKILNVITWQKSDPPPNISCRYFTFSTEYVIWARKSAEVPHVFNYETMKQMNGDKQMTDVWKIPAVGLWEKSCGKHPTQKPLRLLYRIILACTREGDTILDPFAGSCTTGIAANLLGRNFIGFDQSEEYLQIGMRRRQEIEDSQIAEKMLRKMCENSEEATVLVNHARTETVRLMIEKGVCYLRAGDSKGSLLVTQGFERLQYVLLHTNGENCHLFKLKAKGRFQIWTKETLEKNGFHPEHAAYYIVIHFDTKEIPLTKQPDLKQRINTYRAKIRPLSDFKGL